jgi:hypothetical protein
LLQGLAVVKQADCGEGSTRIGHYRDGVADGAFSGPGGRATYAHGLLEGPCYLSFDVLTYHQGRLEGPFTWGFGGHVDTGPEVEPDSRGCHGGHYPIITIGGSIRGTFANGVAVDKLVIGTRKPVTRTQPSGVIDMADDFEAPWTWSEHEISIEPGVPVEIQELGDDAKDFSELLGPAHRWAGWPKCAYDNDSVAHHSPLP